tara:strand:+ start:1677 stop:2369 length:693 start_codon:yes stop_codon:yes gene_type:complete
MGLFGTSNGQLMSSMNANNQSQFKTMNNLLTLQENHVEDFFQYHGEAFLAAMDKLIEDAVSRSVGNLLTNLKFNTQSSGEITLHNDSLAALNAITEENITLDLQTLLATAVNSEVIMQRRMAKQQYLESQGFSSPAQQAMPTQQVNPMGMNPQNIQGGNMGMGMNNAMNQQAMAMNNGSGYPVPPAGYDQMNNAYWIDPATGQMTYTPPTSGLGLGAALTKGVAWAKWLA